MRNVHLAAHWPYPRGGGFRAQRLWVSADEPSPSVRAAPRSMTLLDALADPALFEQEQKERFELAQLVAGVVVVGCHAG